MHFLLFLPLKFRLLQILFIMKKTISFTEMVFMVVGEN